MNYSRPKAIYFFYYAALACLAPFMSLYYLERGLNGAQIGILSGAIPLVTWICAPIWGGFADAWSRHRGIFLLAIAGLGASGVALFFAHSFVELLLAVIAYAVFVAPIVPLTDNAVLDLLGEHKIIYGRVRLWGSIGWGLAAVIIGPILTRGGLSWSFYGFWLFLIVMFAASYRLPMAQAAVRQSFSSALAVLVRNGRFLLLLAASLVYGVTLGVLLSYQFIFMEQLEAGRTLMAWTLTAMTISEIPIWLASSGLLRRLGTSKMIATALAATSLRYFALSFTFNPLWVLPISLLHGPGFAMLWVAGVADADAAAPPGLGATAQSLYAGMMFGLGAAIGGFLGGPAYETIGFHRLFAILGWMCLGMMAAFVAARILPRYARKIVSSEGAQP